MSTPPLLLLRHSAAKPGTRPHSSTSPWPARTVGGERRGWERLKFSERRANWREILARRRTRGSHGMHATMRRSSAAAAAGPPTSQTASTRLGRAPIKVWRAVLKVSPPFTPCVNSRSMHAQCAAAVPLPLARRRLQQAQKGAQCGRHVQWQVICRASPKAGQCCVVSLSPLASRAPR